MSVPVSTTVEVHGQPTEYAMGQMNSMDGDGSRKVAFITGTTGQDGSYLVELLLSKGTSRPVAISTRREPRTPRARSRNATDATPKRRASRGDSVVRAVGLEAAREPLSRADD